MQRTFLMLCGYLLLTALHAQPQNGAKANPNGALQTQQQPNNPRLNLGEGLRPVQLPSEASIEASSAAQLLASQEERSTWLLHQISVFDPQRRLTAAEQAQALKPWKSQLALGTKLHFFQAKKVFVWLDPQQQSLLGQYELEGRTIHLRFNHQAQCLFCDKPWWLAGSTLETPQTIYFGEPAQLVLEFKLP